MILVDTSVWIEFFRYDQNVFPVLKRLCEQQQIVTVGCVFGELLQGAKSQREIGIITGYWEQLPHLDNQDLWVAAGIYAAKHKLFAKGVGLIDAVLVVAAMRNRAQIWTLDKKLRSILPASLQY